MACQQQLALLRCLCMLVARTCAWSRPVAGSSTVLLPAASCAGLMVYVVRDCSCVDAALCWKHRS
jgi:hypothetical protein